MSFFKRDFSKAGPGVPKDLPRKKGAARFFEIIAREYRDLMKVNILFFLCILPSITFFFLGLLGFFEFGLMISILAAYPVGGALTASFFCITRMLRDDPGFLWDDFKRKFLESLRQAGLAGVLTVTFLYTQVFLFWLPLLADWAVAGSAWIIGGFILFLLFSMIIPYVFMHYAYIGLSTFKIVKNSTLIALSNPLRSFMGAISGLLPWIALFMFLPASSIFLPLIPFFVFVLSWLLSLMWVWPVFDKFFAIEEALIKRQKEKYETSESSEPAASEPESSESESSEPDASESESSEPDASELEN